MLVRMGELRKLLSENGWKPEEKSWSVKPGQIMVKSVVEPAMAWRWEFNPSRLTFTKDELKKAPGGPMARQVWIFERAGMLYAIAEHDFYVVPRRSWE